MRHDHPTVSVIVPIHNYAHLVGETLESLQRQTLQEWECLVIDDGSTDQSADVVAQFAARDPRIRYFYQENAGPSAARNRGISFCSGRYLQFLDADDLLEPQKLESHARYLGENPSVDVVYGEVRYFRTDFPLERTLSNAGGNFAWTTHLSGCGAAVLPVLVRANLTAICTPLARREAVTSVELWDEDLRFGEDWDLWFRIAAKGCCFHFEAGENTKAIMRSHAHNSSRHRESMLRGELSVRAKMNDLLSPDYLELQRLNTKYLQGARTLLRLEEVARERKPVTRWLRLIGAGIASRDLKWLLFAFFYPVLKDQRLAPIVSRLKAVILRCSARSSN